MSDEQDKLKLSLEPPKLFGRKKKQAEPEASAEPATPARPSKATKAKSKSGKSKAKDAATVEPEQAAESTAVIEVVDPAEADAAPAPPDAADAELTALIEDVAAAESGPEPAPEPEAAEVVPELEPQAAVVAEPAAEVIAETEPEVIAEPGPREETAVLPTVEDETPAPAKKPSVEKTAPVRSAPAPKTTPAVPASDVTADPVEVAPEPVDETSLEDAEIAERLGRRDGPLLTIYRAAAVTGLTVGVALVVLTWLSLRGCEAVRGTSSCGGGPGFLLLVATFAISVLLGSALLKAFLVPDPGSSSFLAVGMVAVIALLFLIDVLDSWVMLIVVPLLGIGAYLASVWVTKTFVEPTST